MTNIIFHGELAEKFGKKTNLQVNSVPEAFHAIDTLNDSKLRKYFLDPRNRYKRVQVIVNGKVVPFFAKEGLRINI